MQKKIAVILPIFYRGGTLRAAKNVAKWLKSESLLNGHDLRVIFGFPEGKYEPLTEFQDLIEIGIELREIVFEQIPVAYVKQETLALYFKHRQDNFSSSNYIIAKDGLKNLADADLWLVISDRLSAPMLPFRKYALIVFDYIQRYVPQIFSSDLDVFISGNLGYLDAIRQAAHVFVTTKATLNDAVSFAGVRRSRVTLYNDFSFDYIPFDKLSDDAINATNTIKLPQQYFLWGTNVNFHKNISKALHALLEYWNELDGKLKVVITGFGTEYLNPRAISQNDNHPLLNIPHILEFRKAMSDREVQKRIMVAGEVPDVEFFKMLNSSKFAWNPTIYDNGTYILVEAALLGKPSLSALYPATDYWNNKLQLNLVFFDPHNSKEMARKLKWMEENFSSVPVNSKIRELIEIEQKKARKEFYSRVLSLI